MADSIHRKLIAQELARSFLHDATLETGDGAVTPMEWLYPAFKRPDKQIITFRPIGETGLRHVIEVFPEITFQQPNAHPEQAISGRYGFAMLRTEANARLLAAMREDFELAAEESPQLAPVIWPVLNALPYHITPLTGVFSFRGKLEAAWNDLELQMAYHCSNEPERFEGNLIPLNRQRKEREAAETIKKALVLRDELSFVGPTRYAEIYIDYALTPFDEENVDACLTYLLAEQLEFIALHGVHNPEPSHKWDDQTVSEFVLWSAENRMQNIALNLGLFDDETPAALQEAEIIFSRLGDTLSAIKELTPVSPRPACLPQRPCSSLDFF